MPTESLPSRPKGRPRAAWAPDDPTLMYIALTRPPSRRLGECELTHLPRTPIDTDLAAEQHRGYCVALGRLGCDVRALPATPDLPDGVFVEDRAVVLDEVAIITRSAAVSRRDETPSVETVLRAYRPLVHVTAPATLDGGDVLRLDRALFVGLSPRTNADAVSQLRGQLASHGYTVHAVPVSGSLHLKSGCSVLGPDLLVVNRDWVDTDAILATSPRVQFVDVDPAEPRGGNHLLVGDVLLSPDSCPRTVERIRTHGITVETVDVSELEKAEAGVTCSSLVFSPAS